jgi:hypothetical protein
MFTRIRLVPAIVLTATLLIVTVAGAADRVVLGEYFTNLY